MDYPAMDHSYIFKRPLTCFYCKMGDSVELNGGRPFKNKEQLLEYHLLGFHPFEYLQDKSKNKLFYTRRTLSEEKKRKERAEAQASQLQRDLELRAAAVAKAKRQKAQQVELSMNGDKRSPSSEDPPDPNRPSTSSHGAAQKRSAPPFEIQFAKRGRLERPPPPPVESPDRSSPPNLPGMMNGATGSTTSTATIIKQPTINHWASIPLPPPPPPPAPNPPSPLASVASPSFEPLSASSSVSYIQPPQPLLMGPPPVMMISAPPPPFHHQPFMMSHPQMFPPQQMGPPPMMSMPPQSVVHPVTGHTIRWCPLPHVNFQQHCGRGRQCKFAHGQCSAPSRTYCHEHCPFEHPDDPCKCEPCTDRKDRFQQKRDKTGCPDDY